MLRERPLTLFFVFLVLTGAGIAVYRWQAEEAEVRERVERTARASEEETRDLQDRQRFVAELRRESAGLVPEMISGVALGMTEVELRRERQAVRPHIGAADPTLELLTERLPNGAQIVYGLVPDTRLLARIQVMSMLPTPEAVAAHMTAMIETYGRPSGIWNCPDTGGVPTRRFTWRRAETAIADIFLLYADRVSVTLDIAPSDTIGASLQRASCRPIASHEELGNFPAATIEQIRAAQEEASGTP